MSETAPKKSKRNKILLTILFVLFNLAVILFAAFGEFGNASERAELSEVKINFWLIVPAVLCLAAALTFEIAKYVVMMRRMRGEKNSSHEYPAKAFNRRDWRVAARVVLLGKYYDNITPAAIGGQPFQIYYMRKHGDLPSGASTAIPIFGMVAGQMAFLIIALICFTATGLVFENPTLGVAAWIGLLFYAFWPIVIAGMAFFPKATARGLKLIVKFLAAIKIVKNREEALKKVEEEAGEYTRSVKLILNSRGLFIKTLLLSLLFNTLVAAIPFFVLAAFGGGVPFFKCFTTTVAVTSAVYFVPTPGNSGAAEGAFFLVFSSLSRGYVFWAMLVWRFFSYYFYIIVGPIIYLLMRLERKKQNNVV